MSCFYVARQNLMFRSREYVISRLGNMHCFGDFFRKNPFFYEQITIGWSPTL